MNALNLSRSELIAHLQGQPRAKVVETCLTLHSRATAQDLGTFKVTRECARGMVSLANRKAKKKLREQSPDLFDREPTPLEIEQGRAALMAQYRAINISVRGGADLRKSLRRDYPGLFQQQEYAKHY
jgi:hypothetical protein